LDLLRSRQRCLLIADDLTGGADAGAQFAKQGLKTLLIAFGGEGSAPFAAHQAQDVLVINTISRGQSPTQAAGTISTLLKSFSPGDFPILYKKIDSTLRCNIGSEIDAILQETNLSLCFLAPSYPEQGRTLVGGIMMVGGKPLALTEAATDAASPVRESNVVNLLDLQTSLSIGRVDLADVASGKEVLRLAVERERKAGRRIIVFDAVSRRNLAVIAEVAFAMERMPLLAGSAGLAGEVARILAPAQINSEPGRQRTFRHVLVIGGSASAVTHAQLQRLKDCGLPSFELPRDLVSGDGRAETEGQRKLARLLGSALAGGSAIFRTFTERLAGDGDVVTQATINANTVIPEKAGIQNRTGCRIKSGMTIFDMLPCRSNNVPVHQRIMDVMAGAVLEVLREVRVDAGDLALILTGGDTALGVMQLLDYQGIELEGELLEGIVRGTLRGGPWDGLTVVTKAGAFGKEDALVRIVERLTTPAPS